MTTLDLTEIVEQRMSDPAVLGRIVGHLHHSDIEQRHHDSRTFHVEWNHFGDFWRCTVISDQTSAKLAQVDLHDQTTVRVDAFEPCRVTISPEENLLCITRYK